MSRDPTINPGPYFGLDWTLAPITQAAFFDNYFEKKHLVVNRGDRSYWQDLLNFAEVDHVVSTMGLFAPEITVTHHRDPAASDADHDQDADTPQDGYSHESGFIDPVRVAKRFSEGGTVILSGLQERLPKLARFSRALEASLSCRVQTNVYLTPGGNQGFRPHYDSHDVLVLQLEGRKEWRIYDSPVELPLPSQGFDPATIQIGEETDRFVLEPGDLAYIPRGLAHDAVATGETSLHITTGLMFRSWADLLVETVRSMADNDPVFRKALPPGFANSDMDRAATAVQLSTLLQRLANEAPAEAVIETFRTDFISNRVPRGEGHLSQVVRAENLGLVDRVSPSPDLIYDIQKRAGTDGASQQIVLCCQGAEIALPGHAEDALRFALATPEFCIGDLPGDLDDAGKLVLIRRLVLEGLLRLH